MSTEAHNPTLTELLDRVDLSHLPQTEIIRLQAEAARAEYISGLITSVAGKIKALFTSRKPAAVNTSGLRHV